jgi:hypothetical protein
MVIRLEKTDIRVLFSCYSPVGDDQFRGTLASRPRTRREEPNDDLSSRSELRLA